MRRVHPDTAIKRNWKRRIALLDDYDIDEPCQIWQYAKMMECHVNTIYYLIGAMGRWRYYEKDEFVSIISRKVGI